MDNGINEQAIREQLAKSGRCYELHKLVMAFDAFRTTEDGREQRVKIEIFDIGPEKPDIRYHVHVTSEDGEDFATGNGEPSIDMAIRTTHWSKADLWDKD